MDTKMLADTLRKRCRRYPEPIRDLAYFLAANLKIHSTGKADPALCGFIKQRLAEFERALLHSADDGGLT